MDRVVRRERDVRPMIRTGHLRVHIHDRTNTMRSTMLPLITLAAFSLFSCGAPSSETTLPPATADMSAAAAPVQNTPGMMTAYFGAGCFWVEEAMFEDLKGVKQVVSGYSGGSVEKPSYEAVTSGRTGHAETVEVMYDPKVISYGTLLKVFFGSQDPTQVNGQGPDEGTQYRSVVFTQNAEEKGMTEKMITELDANEYGGKIATVVTPFTKFWPAEDYHQGYEKLHPDQPYVANVSKRRYDAFAAKFRDLLK